MSWSQQSGAAGAAVSLAPAQGMDTPDEHPPQAAVCVRTPGIPAAPSGTGRQTTLGPQQEALEELLRNAHEVDRPGCGRRWLCPAGY